MAPRAYSTQLLSGAALDGGATIDYVVPAGFIVVIRDISGGCVPATNINAMLTCAIDLAIFWRDEIPPTLTSRFHWEGRAVAGAFQTITFQCEGVGQTTDVVVSGYLLTAP